MEQITAESVLKIFATARIQPGTVSLEEWLRPGPLSVFCDKASDPDDDDSDDADTPVIVEGS